MELVLLEALLAGMEPRLITEGERGAILQTGAESEWLRTDTTIDLGDWA